MTIDPDALMAELDFPIGCHAHPDCRNAATHYALTTCCGEHADLACGQCRTACLVARDPWDCPRCGKTWEPRAKGLTWRLLVGKP